MNTMKILSKLNVSERTLLTLDDDILSIDASRVVVDGMEYEFDIAYDMKNTICIKAYDVEGNTVEFV